MVTKVDLKPKHVEIMRVVESCVNQAEQSQINLRNETIFDKENPTRYNKIVLSNDYVLFLNHFRFDNGCRYSDIKTDMPKPTQVRLLNNLIVWGFVWKKRFNDDFWLTMTSAGRDLIERYNTGNEERY